MGDNKCYGWNLPFSLIGIGAGVVLGIATGNLAVGIAVGAGLAFMFGLAKPFRKKKKQDQSDN